MDFVLTSEQKLLQKTARQFCAKHATPVNLRRWEEEPGYGREVFAQMGELGWTALPLSEDLGGLGGSALDLALLFEEMGRMALPSPLFCSSVLAGALLERAGSKEQREKWLPKLATAESLFTVALEAPEGLPTLESGSVGGSWWFVPFAASAERVIVPAAEKNAPALLLLDPKSPELRVRRLSTTSREALYEIAARKLPLAKVERLGEGDAAAALRWALRRGRIAKAAEMLGGAQGALEMAVRYAGERVQFDKPIGAFQAVQHPLAQVATDIEAARLLVFEAAAHWDAGKDAPGLAGTALPEAAFLLASDVYHLATRVGHQTLGGFGFTEDADMQIHYRRALAGKSPGTQEAACLKTVMEGL